MPNRELDFSEKERYIHMDLSKEMLGLSMMERVHLAGLSGISSGSLVNLSNEPVLYNNEFNKKDLEEIVDKYIPESKPKVATGRKAGKIKNTRLESLKVQSYVTKLKAKRDEVNEVERILDERKDLQHSISGNATIFYLYPGMDHLYEEHLLVENLKNIQKK